MTTMEIKHNAAAQEDSGWLKTVVTMIRENLPALVFFVVTVAIWELGTTYLHLIPAYLLPAPSAIVRTMFEPGSGLLKHTWVTLTEILLGYLAGVAIGFAGALAIFYSRLLQRIIYPLVLLSQFVPKLAIAPLLIVWFGFTITPKILVTALVCMFPILINTVAGLEASDPRLLDLMHTLYARRFQVFTKIRIPAAMPHIFAGLKVGITLATIGAIVAEWISSQAGLGYLIVFALGFFLIEELFAALVMITLVGLVLFLLVVILEKIVSPHQPSVEYLQESA
jgi:NitT/TauT family transport system permease protein